MSEARESARESCKMAAKGTHTEMVNGRTKAAERESSIIKAKTRMRDKGRGMRREAREGGWQRE